MTPKYKLFILSCTTIHFCAVMQMNSITCVAIPYNYQKLKGTKRGIHRFFITLSVTVTVHSAPLSSCDSDSAVVKKTKKTLVFSRFHIHLLLWQGISCHRIPVTCVYLCDYSNKVLAGQTSNITLHTINVLFYLIRRLLSKEQGLKRQNYAPFMWSPLLFHTAISLAEQTQISLFHTCTSLAEQIIHTYLSLVEQTNVIIPYISITYGTNLIIPYISITCRTNISYQLMTKRPTLSFNREQSEDYAAIYSITQTIVLHSNNALTLRKWKQSQFSRQHLEDKVVCQHTVHSTEHIT